jgi:fructose/tagatose bisphosphate aldolase
MAVERAREKIAMMLISVQLFKYAQEKQFAIPAINVTSSSTV